jgi:hypothetical protein
LEDSEDDDDEEEGSDEDSDDGMGLRYMKTVTMIMCKKCSAFVCRLSFSIVKI